MFFNSVADKVKQTFWVSTTVLEEFFLLISSPASSSVVRSTKGIRQEKDSIHSSEPWSDKSGVVNSYSLDDGTRRDS